MSFTYPPIPTITKEEFLGRVGKTEQEVVNHLVQVFTEDFVIHNFIKTDSIMDCLLNHF